MGPTDTTPVPRLPPQRSLLRLFCLYSRQDFLCREVPKDGRDVKNGPVDPGFLGCQDKWSGEVRNSGPMTIRRCESRY